jgi:hypothetical protein
MREQQKYRGSVQDAVGAAAKSMHMEAGRLRIAADINR